MPVFLKIKKERIFPHAFGGSSSFFLITKPGKNITRNEMTHCIPREY
jgi:hypothetical protein